MTEKHVAAIEVSIDPYSLHEVDVALREVGLFVRSVADGSLRCADSKTVEELAQLVREPCDSNDRMRARAIVSRWLSTPDNPVVSPVSSGEAKE